MLMSKIYLILFLVLCVTDHANAQNAENKTTRANLTIQSPLLKSKEFKQFRSKLLSENDEEVLKLASQLIKDFPKDS